MASSSMAACGSDALAAALSGSSRSAASVEASAPRASAGAADTAVHLVESVIPEVPARQWVCSLPWRLRVLLGHDRRLCAAVLEAFVLALSRSLKRRAKKILGLKTLRAAHNGAVSVMHFVPSALRRPPWTPSNPVQRGDSGLRLNVRSHVLALDGVYVREEPSASLVFHPLPDPTVDEGTDVAKRTALRAKKSLERHGGPMRWLEAATTPDAIARLLARHGLGPRPPPKRPPLGQLWLAFPNT